MLECVQKKPVIFPKLTVGEDMNEISCRNLEKGNFKNLTAIT